MASTEPGSDAGHAAQPMQPSQLPQPSQPSQPHSDSRPTPDPQQSPRSSLPWPLSLLWSPSNASSSAARRRIFVNVPLPAQMLDRHGRPVRTYHANRIRTSKYTPLTFIPKNLFEQFRRLANSYFLLLIIMQAIPIFTVSLTAWLPALPLIVIVGVTAIKDGVEDYRRQLADNQLNKARVHVIASSSNTNFPHSPHPKPASALAPGAFPAKKLANVSTGASTASLGALSKTSLDAVSPSFADSPSGKASFDVMREGWVHTTWSELRVGDFVLLKQNESVPADILVVASSNPDGIVYIETKNLDGETNLKAREAIPDTMHVRNAQDCLDLHAVIESEPPSLNLHTYSGAFLRLDSGVNTSHDSHGQHHHPAKQPYNSVGTLDKLGDLKVPLSAAVAPSDCASSDQQPTATPINIQNVMLRGCIVRNVDYVVGIVLFTGADTKIILNGGATPSKRSNIEERMNVQVACNFAILLSFCIIITVYESRFSFGWAESQMVHLVLGGTSASLVIFGASIIMLQNIVPISLYVTLELVKTIQAYFIYQDIDMYDHVTKETCIPKSWTITDDLGQIEYIFSDKTGTLTQNKMEFRRCSVRGQVYGQGFTDVSIDQSGLNAAERDALTESRVQTMLSQMALVYSNPVISPVLSFIDDRLFQDLHPTTAPDPLLRGSLLQFFMHLAICHTVPTPKRHRVEKLVYAAQSPDEGALVTGAKNAGFVFERREMNRMVVNVLGKRMAVEVLNVLEFNSARKRMSVIVRRDSGDILLMTKGADSVIYKRLAPGQDDLKAVTLGHLAEFATEGLRTLCLAQRVIPLEEYTEWVALYNKAALSLDNRDERLDEAAELIEHSLELVGASAIEDKLQEGVPQTIATLQHAGIKIWVLTGDKMETAINIGHAANLLWQDMTLLVVSGSGRVEVVEQLYRALAQFGLHVGKNASELPSNSTRELYHTESWPSWFLTRLGIRKRGNSSRNGNGDSSNKVSNSDLPHATGRRHNSLFPANRSAQRARRNQHERLVETLNGQGANESLARGYGLIIDGDALEHVFENLATQERLLELGMLCKSVICCRVSPKQKAQVVQLVQRGLGAMCLSIGDGANDVSMIQAAQIGIGISGKEGLQAAMASDFVIGQFRFLSKLMLVHGHWSYYRIAEGILTFFYKNMTWVFAMVWYQFFSGFTALILYDYNYILLFNLIFTSLPPLIIGVLDQDLSQQQILAFPQSYRIGITRSIFSFSRFWSYVADAVYQSAVCYYIAHTLFSETVDASGHPADHIVLGTATAMFAIVTINLTIAMAVKSWTLLTTTAMFLSGISFVIYVPTWAAIGGGKSRGIGEVLFRDPRLYLGLLLSVVVCMLPRVVLTYSRVMFVPTDLDILREIKVAESSQSEYSQVSVDDEDEDEDEPEPEPEPESIPLDGNREANAPASSSDGHMADPSTRIVQVDGPGSMAATAVPAAVARQSSSLRIRVDQGNVDGAVPGTAGVAVGSPSGTPNGRTLRHTPSRSVIGSHALLDSPMAASLTPRESAAQRRLSLVGLSPTVQPGSESPSRRSSLAHERGPIQHFGMHDQPIDRHMVPIPGAPLHGRSSVQDRNQQHPHPHPLHHPHPHHPGGTAPMLRSMSSNSRISMESLNRVRFMDATGSSHLADQPVAVSRPNFHDPLHLSRHSQLPHGSVHGEPADGSYHIDAATGVAEVTWTGFAFSVDESAASRRASVLLTASPVPRSPTPDELGRHDD